MIFVNRANLEVICTENIPNLIKLLPRDYVIYPLQITTIDSVYNISVQADSKQGEETDD